MCVHQLMNIDATKNELSQEIRPPTWATRGLASATFEAGGSYDREASCKLGQTRQGGMSELQTTMVGEEGEK